MPTDRYQLIAEADESTVVSTYQPLDKPSSAYQSEADLEQALIEQLQRQGYKYLPILTQVAELHDKHVGNEEIRLRLEKTINSSPDLRPKRELIEQFIASLTPGSDIHGEWDAFVRRQQAAQIEQIITEENLRREETLRFMTRAFQEGQVQEMGTEISEILPPMPLFSKGNERSKKKERNGHRETQDLLYPFL